MSVKQHAHSLAFRQFTFLSDQLRRELHRYLVAMPHLLELQNEQARVHLLPGSEIGVDSDKDARPIKELACRVMIGSSWLQPDAASAGTNVLRTLELIPVAAQQTCEAIRRLPERPLVSSWVT